MPWYVSLVHLLVLGVLVVVARLGLGEMWGRVWKIVWLTLPVLLFALTRQSGLFLGWFYSDPLVDHGVLLLRLVNFSLSFWAVQRLWYLPLGFGASWGWVRIFWRALDLVMDMWNDVLRWPKERFGLREWIERRYRVGGEGLCQVSGRNIDNVDKDVKE